MRLILTVTPRLGPARTGGEPASVDVEVDAPEGCTVAQLIPVLADHLGLAGGSAPQGGALLDQLVMVVGRRALEPDATIGIPPLLDGTSVSLVLRESLSSNVTHDRGRRRAALVLAVVHGPDSGRTTELHPGRHVIGRSAERDVFIDDPSLSRCHAEVTVTSGAVLLRDLGSTNGTRVDGEPVTDVPVAVTTSSTIEVGDSVLALRTAGLVPAATTARGDGTVAVNRRPRVHEPSTPVTVTVPAAPTPPRRTRVPWVAVLLPLPVSAVLALVVGPTMLAFALMGPVLMLGTALSDRWGSRRTYAAELAAHEARLRGVREQVRASCREELRDLARSAPDAATIATIATVPGERLWERHRHDPDALRISVGRCDHTASVRLVQPGTDEEPDPRLVGAPCTISLADVGVLGVSGDPSRVATTSRWLVGQLVTLHPPSDLQVVALLGDDEASRRWAWLSRIPHCRNDCHGQRAAGLVSSGAEEGAAVATVTDLATMVRDRLAAHGSSSGTGPSWKGPTTVLVLDGAAAFRSVPDLVTVLADGPRVGVLCLALDADRGSLPHEAGAVLDLPTDGEPDLALPGHHHEAFVVDGVGWSWAERLCRSLSPLRDATPTADSAALPVSARLGDRCAPPIRAAVAAGARADGPVALARVWQDRPHTTAVPIGVCATGTFSVDLAADGPHVLVGGTTGSGKSELLRTLVASLALHNTPRHLSFVLVDYKGGAAFQDCADLPHVAGVVTDLDDLLAARALTSLTAEIERRERLLLDAGVSDFVAYQRISDPETLPLARLVVVVDEFRALAEELPAFVEGLVRLASLGRSLGIHLVLATQRPAGVVTSDIKANVNLRIALRVRDRIDSEDVVDSPAAAGVDPRTPGRAHARVGGEALVEFQSAHVGAPRPSSAPAAVRVRSWGPSTATTWDGPVHDDRGTELAEIVHLVQQASLVAGIEPAPAAWLPPLPTQLPHSCLDEPVRSSVVHLGLVDVPERQCREPLALDLEGRGHWAFVGGPGSGRTTALTTVARSACARRGPEAVHVYAVSGGSLDALASLPQVGACVDWADTPRVERLLTRLSTEVAGRRAALARHGHGSLAQWWEAERREQSSLDLGGSPGHGGTAQDRPPPPMLLLVDDWELVAGRHDDVVLAGLVDRVLGLLRDGEAVGLTGVLAGDRSLLLGRAAAVSTHRVVLRLPDPTDAVLLGLAPRQVAALTEPGRALTTEGHLVQLALAPDRVEPAPLTTHVDGSPGRSTMAAPQVGRLLPLRVDPLPSMVTEAHLHPCSLREDAVPIGIGGDEADVLTLDPWDDGRRWIVAGSAGSGVSTTLLLAARSLLESGRPVAVVAHRDGPLDVLRPDHRLAAWCDGSDTTALVAARRSEPSLAVVVDHGDELLDLPVEEVLREVARLVDRDHGLLVVGADSSALASMFRGLAIEVARHRTGVLLGPTADSHARVLGAGVPVDRTGHPGRGHLLRRGESTAVQVALPPGAGAGAGVAARRGAGAVEESPRSPADAGRDSVTA